MTLPLEQYWNPNAFSHRWDSHFMDIAELVGGMSKDPSTKCGAVIVRPDKTICSTGFNGFPRKFMDSPDLYQDRDTKYSRIIHAEMNALLHSKEDVHGYTLFVWPLLPCSRCCVHIIQSGIGVVVAPGMHDEMPKRWQGDMKKTEAYLKEAGVRLVCHQDIT